MSSGRHLYRAPSRSWQRRPASRRRLRRTTVFSVVGLALIIVLVWGWRIRSVEVSGSSMIPNAAVRDAILAELQGERWGIFPRSSMLLMRTGRLERMIRDQFAFASVSVRRRLNGRLDVLVTEQPIVAVVHFPNGPAMLLAGSGQIIAPAPEALNDAASLVAVQWVGSAVGPGGQLMPADTLGFLQALWAELSRAGGSLQPQSIGERSGSTSAFDIHTTGGAVVTAAVEEGTERQLVKLRAVLQQYATPDARASIRIVDLRYGDRVYIQ